MNTSLIRPALRFALAFSLLLSQAANCQPPSIAEMGDTSIVKPILLKLERYFFSLPDSSLVYAEKAYALGISENNYPLINYGLQMKGEAYLAKGDLVAALKIKLETRNLSQLHKDIRREAYSNSFIGFIYLNMNALREALTYCLLSQHNLTETNEDRIQLCFNTSNIAYCYTMLKIPDSASYYNTESIRLLSQCDKKDFRMSGLTTLVFERLGNEKESQNKLDDALSYYRMEKQVAERSLTYRGSVIGAHIRIAQIYSRKKNYDSAIFYARAVLLTEQKMLLTLSIIPAANILENIFKKQGKMDSAWHYLSISKSLTDSIYLDRFSDLQSVISKDQAQQQLLIAEKDKVQNRLIFSVLAIIAIAFLIIALILRRNNQAKQNTNRQLETQKNNLENTLSKLKSTQAQLIQSEKMASLGELTAGIAHEIQNPLNFVNNFSEVNKELINELKGERLKGEGERDNQLEDDILNDISLNLDKINHHGKRADGIIKGMLQHSKTSSGQKELTDINSLAEEYLRLAYHGLRAKDNSFNAELQTKFDPSLGKVNVIPQDIGRVLLNLYNNAFYATNEKLKEGVNDYKPAVSVTTNKLPGNLKITVKDNGIGIPDKIREKIFQPFFTTKPTGEGTGLGLSLAYDIVTKGHGGEFSVASVEGEGSEFNIVLPAVV